MPDDHSKLVPLLPIPNRTVKRLRADDSAGSRVKVGHRQALTAQIAPRTKVLGALCFVQPLLCRATSLGAACPSVRASLRTPGGSSTRGTVQTRADSRRIGAVVSVWAFTPEALAGSPLNSILAPLPISAPMGASPSSH